jgi:AraC family transcriptional regulator
MDASFQPDAHDGVGAVPPLGENGAAIAARPLAAGEDWFVQEVVCRCGPDDPRFEEAHERVSIAAVLSGVFTYRCGNGRAVLTPGALLLGEAGGCFECGHEHGSGDRCVSFHFAPGFVDEVLAGLRGAGRAGFLRAGLPPLEHLSPLMTQARALASGPDPLLAEQLGLNLLAAAFRLDQDAEVAPASLDQEARAVRAVRIIEDRYAEPLTIAGLAAEVGLTRRRLAGAFRRAIGVSPYNYILSRRLQAAAERLRSSADSVLDVALDAGFGDLSEFTRRFAARYGRPPGRYRATAAG